MSIEEFKKEFIQRVQKAFFGDIPEPYAWLDDATLDAYYHLLNRYSNVSVYTINYAEFIEELLNALAPSLREKLSTKSELSEEEIVRFKKVNRMFYGSQFYKAMQDNSSTVQEKSDVCYMTYKIIDTGTKMYGIELVENQDVFLNNVVKASHEIQNALVHEQAKALPTFEPNGLWRGSLKELNDLSITLHEQGFTENGQSFRQVFGKSWQGSMGLTVWKRNITSLMFLFLLVDNDLEDRLSMYLPFLSDRFEFKGGKCIQPKNLREALRGVKDFVDVNPTKLKGEHLIIQNIYSKVFHSPS